MNYLTLAAAAMIAVGGAATAHADVEQSPSSAPPSSHAGGSFEIAATTAGPAVASTTGSLTALLGEWDRAGFNAPSKPSQYRVYGRDGFATSGPGYNAMASRIRSAASYARQGRDGAMAMEVAAANNLLAASNAQPEPRMADRDLAGLQQR